MFVELVDEGNTEGDGSVCPPSFSLLDQTWMPPNEEGPWEFFFAVCQLLPFSSLEDFINFGNGKIRGEKNVNFWNISYFTFLLNEFAVRR